MTPDEQIEHVQALWDRIARHPENVPVTEEQQAELRRRLAAHRADPGAARSWNDVRGAIETTHS